MIDIFISHSSADKEITKTLIDLLRSAIPSISPDRIRCTSVPGYRLPGGADADDHQENLERRMEDRTLQLLLHQPSGKVKPVSLQRRRIVITNVGELAKGCE